MYQLHLYAFFKINWQTEKSADTRGKKRPMRMLIVSVSFGNHSFDPFGSCPLVCIPHVLRYSLNFCSLWFLFPYVLWSPVHSGPVACIPRRFFFPFVCLSLILCVPMLFLFPYINSSLCIVFPLFPLSPCYQIGV